MFASTAICEGLLTGGVEEPEVSGTITMPASLPPLVLDELVEGQPVELALVELELVELAPLVEELVDVLDVPVDVVLELVEPLLDVIEPEGVVEVDDPLAPPVPP